MILVMSGTLDGRRIIELLGAKGYPVVVSTATAYGAGLVESKEGCQVCHQRLNREELTAFLREQGIKLLVDATHPYAAEVSRNAMDACKFLDVPYLRFQRNGTDMEKYKGMMHFASNYEEAAQYLQETEGNILLTTGSKTLEIFTEKIDVKRIFVRVLPTSDVLRKCEALGFWASNIIAMQGPFSKDMNVEMIKKYGIRVLVTKDSGDAGGTPDKLEAARETGISVVMIARPPVNYGNTYGNIPDLVDKVSELYEKILSHHVGY